MLFRSSEEWFRTTLSSIGDAVIATDRSGTVTFLNAQAEKLTGTKALEARGKSIGQVFPIFSEFTGDKFTGIAKIGEKFRVYDISGKFLELKKDKRIVEEWVNSS